MMKSQYAQGGFAKSLRIWPHSIGFSFKTSLCPQDLANLHVQLMVKFSSPGAMEDVPAALFSCDRQRGVG